MNKLKRIQKLGLIHSTQEIVQRLLERRINQEERSFIKYYIKDLEDLIKCLKQ